MAAKTKAPEEPTPDMTDKELEAYLEHTAEVTDGRGDESAAPDYNKEVSE